MDETANGRDGDGAMRRKWTGVDLAKRNDVHCVYSVH
jgi:hypothetical protein